MLNRPPLTDLQFEVIASLIPGEKTGPELLEALKGKGWRRSLAAFYQLMRRLEDAGFVDGEYQVGERSGYTVKLRRYRVSGEGIAAFNATREHLLDSARRVRGGLADA